MIADGQNDHAFGRGAAVASAIAVGALSVVTLTYVEFDPLSRHMLVHIATMNILAPLLAAGLSTWRASGAGLESSTALWSASLAQVVLLWAWHGPAVQHVVHSYPVAAFILYAALLLSALAFWCAVIASAVRPWQTILALLITGKLACLLGALLVFSPRLLSHGASSGVGSIVPATSAIADQHLAGLLMLAACPLSYILAAVVLTAQEISCLQRRHGAIRQDRSPVGS